MAEEIQRPDEHEYLFGARLLTPEGNFVSEKPSLLCLLSSETFGQDLKIASRKLRYDALHHN